MNRTTNLFVLLIVISFILPATAIRYAQAASENSQDSNSSSAGNGQESGSSNTGNGQESGSSNTGNGQESGSSSSGNEQQQSSSNTGNGQESGSSSTGNAQQLSNGTGSVPQSNGSTASNNTGNASAALAQEVDANSILAVHNSERAAVGVPPLRWSDKLAADAKTYAEYLATTGKFEHPSAEWVAAHPTGPEGENLAARGHTTEVPIDHEQAGWVSEKKNYHGEPGDFNGVGHYTQMVWNTTKEVGCAAASDGKRDILDCRYSPPGNYIGQKPY